MKLVKLTNTSGKRLAFPVRGPDGTKLVIEPKETKNVSPATIKHPTVSRYIGQGLEVEGDSATTPKQKEPEKTPAPSPAPPAAPISDAEPSEDEPSGELEKPAEEPAGGNEETDIRVQLLSDAPGVTEDNVDAVLGKYPTVEALSTATKGPLTRAGVSKSFVNRLVDWAKEQN